MESTQSNVVVLQITIRGLVSLPMANGRLTDPERTATLPLPVDTNGVRAEDIALSSGAYKYCYINFSNWVIIFRIFYVLW